MAFPWTEDRIHQLEALWRSGHSASQIVAKLGGGLTRNAVIGKCTRLGLTSASRLDGVKLIRKTYTFVRNGVQVQDTLPPRARAVQAPPVARAAHPRPPKPGPQNRPAVVLGGYQHETDFAKAEIVRAKKTAAGMEKVANVSAGAGVESPNAVPMLNYVRGCKWPLGERGAVHYCCNPQAPGRVYCEGHRALSIARDQPQGVRDRDASRLTRFDRVEREPHRAAPVERSLWDDAREAA